MRNQSRPFSLKKALILVTILALPGFCYYLLQEKGENRYKPLPFYGEKELSGTFHTRRGKKIPDTIYHQVASFSMLNSAGKEVTFNPDSGVSIIAFFYTGNQQLSTRIQQAMKRVATRFKDNDMVNLFSITVDPFHDTPSRLQQYRKKWGVFPQWEFLSADSSSTVVRLARQELLVDVVYAPNANPPFSHSSRVVLIDSKRRIRGYYDTLVKDDVDKLLDEVTLLLTEEYRNISTHQL